MICKALKHSIDLLSGVELYGVSTHEGVTALKKSHGGSHVRSFVISGLDFILAVESLNFNLTMFTDNLQIGFCSQMGIYE